MAWLTITEAAAISHLHRDTIRKYCHKKVFMTMRISKWMWYIDEEDFKRWLRARKEFKHGIDRNTEKL